MHAQVDVAFQYLTFFMEDDDELGKIAKDYSEGRMMSGDVKKRLTQVLVVSFLVLDCMQCMCDGSGILASFYALFPSKRQELLESQQHRRALVTDDVLAKFMSIRKLRF